MKHVVGMQIGHAPRHVEQHREQIHFGQHLLQVSSRDKLHHQT